MQWARQKPGQAALAAGLVFLALMGVGPLLSGGNPSQPADSSVLAPVAVPTVPAGPAFDVADSYMDDRRTALTDAQRIAYWNTIQGTQVTWSGEVVEVEASGQMRLKCNPQTWTSDTSCQLEGAQLSALASIRKGNRVMVTGILASHGLTGYVVVNLPNSGDCS